jgi:hypothetical protein
MSAERHTFIVRLSRDAGADRRVQWRGTVQHVETRAEHSVQTVDEVKQLIEKVLGETPT